MQAQKANPMLELLNIMFTVIAPIFLVVGVAYVIGRRFQPNPRGLSVFLIYLFIPALVFKGVYETEVTGAEIGGVAGVVLGGALAMMLIGMAVSRWLSLDRRTESALVLSVIMVNAANYGIPLNTFAFGEPGGNIAILFYVVSAMMGNVLGVFFASRGSVSLRDALLNIVRVPILYAALLGLVLNVADVELPTILRRSVLELAANAAIPGMLALLGLQLSRVRLKGRLGMIALGAGLRLLVGPLVGLAFALLFGLSGVAFRVSVVESSMPTAVLASALATQFGGDAEYVSAVTLVGTLASIVTLSVLIFLLGGVV